MIQQLMKVEWLMGLWVETLQHMEIICIYFIYLLIAHILHTQTLSHTARLSTKMLACAIIDIWFAVIDSRVAAAAAPTSGWLWLTAALDHWLSKPPTNRIALSTTGGACCICYITNLQFSRIAVFLTCYLLVTVDYLLTHHVLPEVVENCNGGICRKKSL